MVTSRKKTEKSNIRIGIFSGKSASYNLAILETLFQKQATTWQIADTLQKNIKPTRGKDAMYYRKQKIYSVIQRKSGRLADLKSKEYIKETEGKWKLAQKGLIALSIKRPDLVASGLQASENIMLTKFKEQVNALPNETIKEPFGIQIDLSKIKLSLQEKNPTSFLRMLLEESRVLLSEGIELDRINAETLFYMAMARSISQARAKPV
jgi:hypothetical protein